MVNFCLDLFKLTCSGNYPLRQLLIFHWFKLTTLVHNMVSNSFAFYSDFRRPLVNSKTFSLPPSPYIMTFGWTGLTDFTCTKVGSNICITAWTKGTQMVISKQWLWSKIPKPRVTTDRHTHTCPIMNVPLPNTHNKTGIDQFYDLSYYTIKCIECPEISTSPNESLLYIGKSKFIQIGISTEVQYTPKSFQ